MINDGLWCSFENCHMGMSGEVVAEKYHVGRARTGRATPRESHRKAAQATREGWFKDEILPITIPQKKGERRSSSIATSRFAKIRPRNRSRALKPAFKKDGTVTAGNAPGVNDGAAALVVMCADQARALA